MTEEQKGFRILLLRVQSEGDVGPPALTDRWHQIAETLESSNEISESDSTAFWLLMGCVCACVCGWGEVLFILTFNIFLPKLQDQCKRKFCDFKKGVFWINTGCPGSEMKRQFDNYWWLWLMIDDCATDEESGQWFSSKQSCRVLPVYVVHCAVNAPM